ncbi:hypothetical protein RJ639_015660 [Escallonia herrerae]|uniref:MBD domain-containing protein n=1 Tax=Escallonia herrerae TaxID=1293975 RepID=A0AA88VE29_9ASTE|nr:hypothetical protein RJ639_015660 [Escallonia herrerae]
MEEQKAVPRSMQLVPLQRLRRGYHGHGKSNHRQLVVVAPTTTTSSSFKLPDGWVVEEVPRSDGSRVDKLISAQVYTKPYYSQQRPLQMLRLDDEESNRWQLAVVAPRNAAATSPYNLPDGWVVEEVPRSSGGSTDKYYYEPGTGQKFRSLVAVEKHLTELKENPPLSLALADLKEYSTPLSKALAELKEYNTPLAKAFKLRSHVKKCRSLKKICSSDNVQASTFSSPPAKVKWVLASPGGDAWNPFIGETLIQESVKQQWSERFILAINEMEHDLPTFPREAAPRLSRSPSQHTTVRPPVPAASERSSHPSVIERERFPIVCTAPQGICQYEERNQVSNIKAVAFLVWFAFHVGSKERVGKWNQLMGPRQPSRKVSDPRCWDSLQLSHPSILSRQEQELIAPVCFFITRSPEIPSNPPRDKKNDLSLPLCSTLASSQAN